MGRGAGTRWVVAMGTWRGVLQGPVGVRAARSSKQSDITGWLFLENEISLLTTVTSMKTEICLLTTVMSMKAVRN